MYIFQPIIDEAAEENARKSSPETTRKGDSKPDVVINMPVPEMHSVGGVLVHMPHVCFLININSKMANFQTRTLITCWMSVSLAIKFPLTLLKNEKENKKKFALQ